MDPSTIASGGGFPDLGLSGAVIVVTGAGTGIGAATALRLGAAGANVVLVGRRSELLDSECPCRAGGRRSGALRRGRSRRAESTGRIVAEAVGRFGTVDGIVDNAAIVRACARPGQTWEVEGFDEHVAVNVRAAPSSCFAAPSGTSGVHPVRSVVNISSSSGILRLAGQSVYGLTKAALNYMTQSLAGEPAGTGIRGQCCRTGPDRHPDPRDVGGRPGRGLPLAGGPGPARSHRGRRRDRPLGRLAAEPRHLVRDRRRHPRGPGSGHQAHLGRWPTTPTTWSASSSPRPTIPAPTTERSRSFGRGHKTGHWSGSVPPAGRARPERDIQVLRRLVAGGGPRLSRRPRSRPAPFRERRGRAAGRGPDGRGDVGVSMPRSSARP